MKFALLFLPFFFSASLACSSFPSQIHHAATSIITVWWWFKPASAFTLTTEVSAAPPAPVPRKHSPTHFKRTTSAGDAASGRLNSLQVASRFGKKTKNSTVKMVESASACGSAEHGLIFSHSVCNRLTDNQLLSSVLCAAQTHTPM